MMNVIVLGAGHGTRLERDLKSNGDKFEHLRGLPKLLLPISSTPLLSRWLDIFQQVDDVGQVYIGTNDKFLPQLEAWKSAWGDRVSVVSDGTKTNDDRLGAISCISFVSKYFQLDKKDVVIMAGDLLFKESFDMKDMLNHYQQLKKEHPSASLVASYRCKEQDVSRHGILELEGDNRRVVSLLEKPLPTETTSRSACPCFYILSPEAVNEIDNFLESNKHLPLEKRDAPGNLITWLVTRQPVFAYEVEGRFDVGNLQSYLACDQYFQSSDNNK